MELVNIKSKSITDTTNTSYRVFCYIYVHKISVELLFLSDTKVTKNLHGHIKKTLRTQVSIALSEKVIGKLMRYLDVYTEASPNTPLNYCLLQSH
jgi:hypothetical protein